MGCDVNSLLGQAKKVETDLGKIRAGEKYYDLVCTGNFILSFDSKFLNFVCRMVFEALMEK
jgi:hypothetical protein